MNGAKKVSIVIPCFNESEGLIHFYNELVKHLPKTYIYEIILVNDGSSDNTLDIIKQILSDQPNLRFISFSRNFGHQYALKAGFDLCTGDCAICLDADLQHPPELIPDLLRSFTFVQLMLMMKTSNSEIGLYNILHVLNIHGRN